MDKLERKFSELFGDGNTIGRFFCPGRVNLIGEHIDYLGGLVMPAAISLGITALVRPNHSKLIRLFSNDFEELLEYRSEKLPKEKQGIWSDYVVGVIQFLQNKGIPIEGFDLLIDSSLPKGSGLSSSAALEVLIYYSLCMVFGNAEPNRSQMALDCQDIENNFVGVNCGIMDQFAVANGKKNHAIKLNCDSLEFEYIPLNLGDYELLIVNSNKQRELTGSAYNQRRVECDTALQTLQGQDASLKNLVDAKLNDIHIIEDETIKKRAKHAINENSRVLDSAVALTKNELVYFGQLMNASHESLSKDFEVSCTELDFIANHLQESDGCLGARMTGAGFGGCCIAIVEHTSASNIIEKLNLEYHQQFGLSPSFYRCKPSDGVRMLVQD